MHSALAGESWSVRGGHSRSKQEHKAAFYLIVRIRGGAKIVKRTAQNHKEKVTKYLNQPQFGRNAKVSHAKYCSTMVYATN